MPPGTKKPWYEGRVVESISLLVFTAISIFNPILVRLGSHKAKETGTAFLVPTTVLGTEVIKIVLCCIVIPIKEKSLKGFFVQVLHSFTVNRTETLKVCLPALLFVVQNNLYFFALQRIDSTLFSVTYQLRILTTAVLTMLILHRRFSSGQWSALIMSLVGVVIVQLGEQSTQINLRAKQTATVASGRTLGINMITGLAAVLVMCLTSAFASVYLEATFKKSDADIFVQNIRLSLISLPMAGATVLANFKTIQDSGFFTGWNHWVWIVIFVRAFAGIIVSAVILHSDNIKKGFCQVIALGGTAVVAILLGDSTFSVYLLVGLILVLVSVALYIFASNKL